MVKLFLLFASINGMVAVVLGAFGAHALKAKISPALLAAYQTGTHYHLIHVISLIGLALLILRLQGGTPAPLIAAGFLWMAGTVLFSGSLYGLALGAPNWFGPITPVGGLLLIIGWLCFAIGIARSSL
ncbi:MAG: uncharacterized membrane protein YgdD (TMEM256/DUF423 family) [Candidatus Endobugula sp.]|jgi:uncharacterized membrane protein YgdD (TMEM256/DUF423 family)